MLSKTLSIDTQILNKTAHAERQELSPTGADLIGDCVHRLFERVSAETPDVPMTFFPEMGDARPDYNHINWVLMAADTRVMATGGPR